MPACLAEFIPQTALLLCGTPKTFGRTDFSGGGTSIWVVGGILIFCRSNDWNNEQREAFRILNSSYHNLTIMTYDHVLNRAKRILGIDEVENIGQDTEDIGVDSTPF